MSYLRVQQRAHITVHDYRGVREVLRMYPGAIVETIRVTKRLTPVQRRRMPAEVKSCIVRVLEVK